MSNLGVGSILNTRLWLLAMSNFGAAISSSRSKVKDLIPRYRCEANFDGCFSYLLAELHRRMSSAAFIVFCEEQKEIITSPMLAWCSNSVPYNWYS